MDELGGCLFELVGKVVSTKVGCTLLVILAIVGGYFVSEEIRAGGWDKPSPYDEGRAPDGTGAAFVRISVVPL